MSSGSPSGQHLVAQAQAFADEIASLLGRTVVSDPPIGVERRRDRAIVGSFDGQANIKPMPIEVNGTPAIELSVSLRCGWDSYGDFLAIEHSSFRVYLAHRSSPFLRFEYVRGQADAKSAHIHVHAENSALGYLFAVGQPDRAPNVQSLHLPVGGKRFRPSLEDVVAFLVDDMGADAQPDWRRAVEAGRERWQQHQADAVARDHLEVAKRMLERYDG